MQNTVTHYTIFSIFSHIRGRITLGKDRAVYSWQDYYIAALAETDPAKLRRRVYEAVAAIEQRRLSPVDPGSEEYDAIERAEKALEILTRTVSEG
jgi:hypothetical protein